MVFTTNGSVEINFEGTTNKDYLMVNTARFRYPDGREVTIDRDATYYDIEDGSLSMEWCGCYIWNEEDEAPEPRYLTAEDADELAKAELIGLELEDDADEDYSVEIETYCVC